MQPHPLEVEHPEHVAPETVWAALRGEPGAFWLDAGPGARSGWSIVGTGRRVPASEVRAVVLSSRPSRVDGPPFRGGYVGWVGYEPGAAAAGAPVAPGSDPLPGELWLRAERFVAFDHATGRVWAAGDIPSGGASVGAGETDAGAAPASPARVARARVAPAEYAARIAACREAIRAGDAYQLCLTTRFEVDGPVAPETVRARLRRSSPSHHGLVIRSDEVALIGASPEIFLDVRGGVVRTHPIKGTRARGATPEEDAALRDELVGSAKEQAENVMIVDLMRNDLAQVCETGSVTVERLREVESYPAVHQLVSTVAGRIRPGTTVADLLRTAFPAGSMTGAPKLSAMTILHRLEQEPRGVFAGCAGWVGDDGDLDLAMTIRSICVHPDGAYVGAGGGITWHSVAAEEVAEVGLKARAPLAAVGATVPPGW